MNKLDDFLKSKLNDAFIDVPSEWDTLNQALPTQKTGRFIAGWAISILVLSGVVATLVIFNNTPQKAILTENSTIPALTPNENVYFSQNNSNDAERSSLPVAKNATSARIYGSPATVPSIDNSNSSNYTINSDMPVSKQENAAVKADDYGKDKTETYEKNDALDKSNSVTNSTVTAPAKTTPREKNTSPATTKKAAVRPKVKTKSDFHKGKLYASASVSLIGSYRSFQLNNGAAPFVNKLYDNIRQNSEQATVTNGFSIAAEYRFIKNFSVQGGVSYNKIGFQSYYDFEVTDIATTDPNTGRITGYENLATPKQIVSNGRTSIGVLRIPFGINYNLLFNSNSLFHIYVGGSHDVIMFARGISLNQLTLEQKPISKTDFVNNANELCVDMGVNFALASRYGIGFDLFYNKWVTDISKNKYENVTPFSGGINVSLSRKIF